MSNKRKAIVIGLASVTFFTGCIAGITQAEQNKKPAPKAQLPQPEIPATSDAAAAKQLPGLPATPPASDIPAAVLPPTKPTETAAATAAPTQAAVQPTPEPTPQPAASNSAAVLMPVAPNPTPAAPTAPAVNAKSKTTKTRAS